MTQIEQREGHTSSFRSNGLGMVALELRAIYEISQIVGSALYLDEALSQILHVLHTTLSMERATLVLLDEAGKILSIRASYGLTHKEEKWGVFGLNKTVCKKIFLKLHRTICRNEKTLMEENRSLRAEVRRLHNRRNILRMSKAIYEVLEKCPHSLRDLEREEVEAALRRHGWVQARAARDLGLTQRQIGYRIKKYGLRPPGSG